MAETILQQKSIYHKLLKFQRSSPAIHKNCTASVNGRQYRYADLPSVLAAVTPALNACGLVLSQSIDGQNLKTSIIDSETGESLESVFPLEFQGLTWHAIGSAISYARRYAILSLCGLTADDDDDAAATLPPAQNGHHSHGNGNPAHHTNGHQNGHGEPQRGSNTAPPETCEVCGREKVLSQTGKRFCYHCWSSRKNGNGHTNGHSHTVTR